MPGKNKTPLLGWHPPAELSAWVRDEAERRSVPISAILNEAVEAARDWAEAGAEVVVHDLEWARRTSRNEDGSPRCLNEAVERLGSDSEPRPGDPGSGKDERDKRDSRDEQARGAWQRGPIVTQEECDEHRRDKPIG